MCSELVFKSENAPAKEKKKKSNCFFECVSRVKEEEGESSESEKEREYEREVKVEFNFNFKFSSVQLRDAPVDGDGGSSSISQHISHTIGRTPCASSSFASLPL